ncbi:DoxX family protein [Brevundimonas vancanneytii]|uniref:DoxX family protein n=1 Tax=Brevundimonas vancanneytii TaxID=1325724 RepID=UPI0010FD669C|nr:DoxX family protein [Brevundimonas vancanneytii]
MLPRSWVAGARRPGPTSPAARRSRLYAHLFLWVMQSWLAMFYIGAGYAKLTQKHDLLALMMTWPAQVDTELLRVIGGIETALALFIVAPLMSWSLFRSSCWSALPAFWRSPAAWSSFTRSTATSSWRP